MRLSHRKENIPSPQGLSCSAVRPLRVSVQTAAFCSLKIMPSRKPRRCSMALDSDSRDNHDNVNAEDERLVIVLIAISMTTLLVSVGGLSRISRPWRAARQHHA